MLQVCSSALSHSDRTRAQGMQFAQMSFDCLANGVQAEMKVEETPAETSQPHGLVLGGFM